MEKRKAFLEVCENFRFYPSHLLEIFYPVRTWKIHLHWIVTRVLKIQAGLLCTTSSLRNIHNLLTGLRKDCPTQEVWQLVRW